MGRGIQPIRLREWQKPRQCQWKKCHSGPDGTPKVFIPKRRRQIYCCAYHRVAACQYRAKIRPVNEMQLDVHNKINRRLDVIQNEVDSLRKELSIPDI